MASEDESDVPETGAVFTFGKSQFADNIPNKFWIRDDKVIQVCCGDEHTALVAGSGRVFTFGANEWGQLGLGHNRQIKKPTKIKESGKLYSFGANGEGQLGLGHTDNVSRPTVIESLEDQQYTKLAAGADHSVILTEKGVLYVWGSNCEGQLGLGEEQEAWQPVRLKLDEKIISVACGYYHTALVTENGDLYTFGETEDGKLGLGHDPDEHKTPQKVDGIHGKVVHVSCGGKHTVAVTDTGKMYTFGDGANGQLGHGTTLLSCDKPEVIKFNKKSTKVRRSSCGENHTAIITAKGHLFTFGDGRHGKLALGEENFSNQFKPILVERFMHFIVEDASCGGCHMLISAKPRVENGDMGSSEEDEDEECSDDEDYSVRTDMNGTVRNSIDLNGTLSARNRRREKLPDPGDTIKRTLPPLDSSLSVPKQLSPLNRTLPPLSSEQLSRKRPPAIGLENEPVKKQTDEFQDSIGEESDDSKPAIKKLSSQTVNTVPMPRPRPIPRKSDAAKEVEMNEEGKEESTSNEESSAEQAEEENVSKIEEVEEVEEMADRQEKDEDREQKTVDEEDLEKADVVGDVDEGNGFGETEQKPNDGSPNDDEQKAKTEHLDGEDEGETNDGQLVVSDRASGNRQEDGEKEERSNKEHLGEGEASPVAGEVEHKDADDDGDIDSEPDSDERHLPVIEAEASNHVKSIPVPAERRKSRPSPDDSDRNNDDYDDKKKDSGRESASSSEEEIKEKIKPKRITKKNKKRETKTNFFGRRKIVHTDSEDEMQNKSEEMSSDDKTDTHDQLKLKKKKKKKKQAKKESPTEGSDVEQSDDEQAKPSRSRKNLKKNKRVKMKVPKERDDDDDESKNSEDERRHSETSEQEKKIVANKTKEVKRTPQKKPRAGSENEESGLEKKSPERKRSESEQESAEEENKQSKKKKTPQKKEKTENSNSESGQNHEVNQSAEKCENKVDSKVMHTSGPAKGESDSDKQQRVLTEADVLQLQDALKKARAELRKYEDEKNSPDEENKKKEMKEEQKPQEKKKEQRIFNHKGQACAASEI
ncbi:hypothetical protein LSH36_164g05038 [Paralvinella palmiformis]|uniref:RCC1-like domain-containing protein n=1 Tax=Paralvinella palmiformis TaxID=53620 RepID=A0AAD9JV19_9ANNE|nr:hypothetical protein LSH36_164g05038 [Paralvinella palmiformis]